MLVIGALRDGTVERNIAAAQLPELLAAEGTLVWADVFEPTDEDWQSLERDFQFHPLALEDAQKHRQRPKVDEYREYLFLSLRIWTGFSTAADSISTISDEIDAFLGPRYLVTVHERACETVVEQRERWLEHPESDPRSSAYLLYMLLDTVVDSYFPAMDWLDEEIDKLETAVYASDSMPDWGDALLLKKRLLLLRQVISPTRDLMNHFLRAEQPLIPPDMRIYFQDVYDHTLRLVEQVDLHRDIITGVLDAMMAQVSNRLNQVMKTLTAVSIVLMTDSLIAGIYGMNFVNMPELHARWGYFVVIGAMAALTGGMLWYFKRIKWL